MKKGLLFMMIIACLLSAGALKAQTTVSITAGGLASALSGQTDVTTLKVNGTIDARDFQALRSIASTLISIDLSGITKIEAYQGNQGPAIGEVTYAANEVPERAFLAMRNLNTVVLPTNAGITSIGFAAFNQSGVTELTIPDGVISIGDNAFGNPARGSSQLKKVILPNSLITLGALAFRNSDIEEIVMSNKLEEIKESTFEGTNLTSISIPSSVTRIGNNAFASSTNLTNVIIPVDSKLEWLGGVNTFQGTAVGSLQLPSGIKIIDGKMEGTFSGCPNLTSFNIPANVTEIGKNAFYGTAITSVVIPDGVTTIGQDAFRNAPITSIILSKNLSKLGPAALRDLAQLETLELPASLKDVRSIGSQAFAGMVALKKLIVNNPNPDIFDTETNVFRDINKETSVLYVPVGKVNDYKNAYLWKEFKNIQEIGSNAVAGEITGFDDITAAKGTTITLNAGASGNRPVIYSIEAGKDAVATLSGNKLTIVGEGSAKITAKAEGNNDYQASEKTITLTVVSYEWLEEVTISVTGNTARVVGKTDAVTKFTKFYVNDAEVTLTNGVADLTDKTGELNLKATTADGSEVIRLKINKQ